ncbi:MAG: DUF3857 domain-containing transglutaminase family protein, partial [Armatimonadetes bacterium]|nr:DUF3857 domain-containing transglutaminase family protein [Armatimonadota bacterium]
DRARTEVGEVRLPYTAGDQTITITFARTIRPDGSVVEVKPDEIHDQAYGDGDMYTDARVKAFSMPALEEGAIVDYQYVIEDKNPYIPGGFWTGWYFGGLEPRMQSRLTITAPKEMVLRETPRNVQTEGKMNVMTRTKTTVDASTVKYTYEMRGINPLAMEPLMPSPMNYLAQINISTLQNWQDVAGTYWNLAKDRMVADAEIKRITAEVTKGKTTPEEKAKAIFYYVEEKTRYVAKELGIGAIQPRPAALTCAYKYGDCKDMTTLLVAMCKEAGITAHPVLLRAGSDDPVSDKLPSMDAFNHAIALAEINGKKYWLDATAQIATFGEIPGADRGSDALVIRDGIGKFEVIPQYAPDDNRQLLSAKLTLSPEGAATGTVTITSNADNNMALRSAFLNTPPEKHKQLIEALARGIAPNPRITTWKVSDFKNKDVPVAVTFDATFPSWAKRSGDLLLFAARPEQNEGRTSSPFGQDTIRLLPVTQQTALRGETSLELTLPAGYALLSPPTNADIKSDLGNYQRTVSVAGDRLTISTRGTDYRASVAANKYSEVQSYFDNYLKAAEESVVVKKK